MTSNFLIAAFVALLGSIAAAQVQETCFLKGQSQSGQNRTCVYSCPSGNVSETIKSYEICAYSIQH